MPSLNGEGNKCQVGPLQGRKSSFTPNQMSTNQTSSVITPVHIQRAKAALLDAGIPVAVGNQALDLATVYYHETPQVSQTDAMRRERNRIQDELETVSSQLQQERHRTQRLEQELAALGQLPKTHQNKAYQLRKRLRAILAVLEHPQAKETTKLKRIAELVAGSSELEDGPEQRISE